MRNQLQPYLKAIRQDNFLKPKADKPAFIDIPWCMAGAHCVKVKVDRKLKIFLIKLPGFIGYFLEDITVRG